MNSVNIPTIEKESLASQMAFQGKALQHLLEYVYQNSTFYQRAFKAQGILPGDIQFLEDIAKLPVTTKQDLQVNNWDFLCVPKQDLVEITATSGTLGKPVMIGLNDADVQRLAYNERLSFQNMNVGKGDVVQLLLTLDRQFMAGMAYYHGATSLGATVVRSGPGLPAMQWDTIFNLNTTVLVAVPSFVVKLLEYAKQNGIDFRKSKVKKILCIGETIRDEQLNPNALAQRILSDWDVELYGTYAATEMQTAFTECLAGKGGHIRPELIIIEILDDENNPVKEGEMGEITITTLGVSAMPLVRYKTGDIARIYEPLATSARQTRRLGPVLGRKQQMIKYKGTTLFPTTIQDALNELTFIENYCIEIAINALGQDELCILLSTSLSEENLLERILPHCKHKLRVVPQIKLLSDNEILQLQLGSGSRKVQRILDKRIRLID